MGVRKRKRVPWGWISLLLAALAGAGGGGWYYWQTTINAAKLPPGVQAALADRANLDETISATGVVAAQTGAKVNIGSQISGRIRSLPADVGTTVRRGQVV